MNLQIIGITGIPLIKKGDHLDEFILKSLQDMGLKLHDNDVMIIAETAVVKAEGNVINLKQLSPGEKAFELAEKTGKEPEVVEKKTKTTKKAK